MKSLKYLLTMSLLLLSFTAAAQTLPDWVSTFGTHSGMSSAYITGFGMSPRDLSGNEAIEAAKNQAMSDLIRQVQVQISSETVDRFSGDDRSSNSYFTSVSKSSSSMELPGVDFNMEQHQGTFYALAFVHRPDLTREIIQRAAESISRILELQQNGLDFQRESNNSRAAESFARALPLITGVYQDLSLVRVLSDYKDKDFFILTGFEEFRSIADFISLEQDLIKAIESIRGARDISLDQALEKILFLLKEQQVKSGRLQNPALTFQQTDFSSPFGKYTADKLAQLLEGGLPPGGNETVIQGSYWLNEDRVELLIQARDSREGRVIGSASAQFPRNSLPASLDLEPQNHVQSLIDLMEFQHDALVDGGISLDIWTDKGRNEDVLVYSKGEEMQLYFRVNQPCFLQLTYFLASGEKVLLEEKFYIGIDKVNRVVALPYKFEVVPPLGVERLVVTAYSTEPPAQPVRPQIIEGEQYMVFGTMAAVVAQTRGLRRQETSDQETRTGEAQLAITTLE